MRKFLQMENALLFLLVLYLYLKIFNLSLLLLIAFLFVPDISMIGYLINPRIGAYMYNSVHNLIVPCIALYLGLFFQSSVAIYVGLILFLHIFMDRTLGYGLKYSDDFKHTHLNSK